MIFEEWQIDESWTLFLDRDGVINRRIEKDYVRDWAQFEFLPGALDALAVLTQKFGYVTVVTNQRGVARGLMTAEEVENICDLMTQIVGKRKGVIHKYYYCPHNYDDNCDCRKPRTGMGRQAQWDNPDINFKRSVMIGDSISDMEFGKRLGMKTIYLSENPTLFPEHKEFIDYHTRSLQTLAVSLR